MDTLVTYATGKRIGPSSPHRRAGGMATRREPAAAAPGGMPARDVA